MVKVNCNNFRNFIKAISPIGEEVWMKFDKDNITVLGVDGSNALGAVISIPVASGYIGELGISLETLGNLLPKGIDEVEMMFERETTITADGYRAKVMSINKESCARVPKDGLPAPEHDRITVQPQHVYEKLQSLKAAFKGNDSFAIVMDPQDPNRVTFSDEDTVVGSMVTTIPTSTPVTKPGRFIYSYDLVMPALNAIRLSSGTVDLRFRQNPKDPNISLLFFCGVTQDTVPITYQYMFAPRVETP